MTCQDSFHEVAFNISFWTRNISSARILFWRGVYRYFFEENVTKSLAFKLIPETLLNFLFVVCNFYAFMNKNIKKSM